MKYAPGTNVREWTMRLLQRYRYVVGASDIPSRLMFRRFPVSPTSYHMLTCPLSRLISFLGGTSSMFERMMTLQQVRGMLAAVDRSRDLALLCINDDVTRDDAEIAAIFRRWQEKRWGHPAAWEADAYNHRRTLIDSGEPTQ